MPTNTTTSTTYRIRRKLAVLAIGLLPSVHAISQPYTGVAFPPDITLQGRNGVLSVTMRVPSGGSAVQASVGPSGNSMIRVTEADGLGRAVSVTDYKGGGGGASLVRGLSYDGRGRLWRETVPAAFLNGQEVSAPPSSYRPHTEYGYEQAPSSRLVSALPPGEHSHAATRSYRLSTAADAVMHLYATAEGVLRKLPDYGAGALRCTVITDEDGKVTHEFRDSRDSLVATRRGGQPGMETCYVYDGLGRLCHVLPPDAADAVRAAPVGAVQGLPALDGYAWSYRYDRRGNVTYRKQPGAVPAYLRYDRTDLPCAESDADGGGAGDFTVYDSLRRVVMSGHTSGCQAIASAVSAGNVRVTYNGGAAYFGYSRPYGCVSASDVNIVNWYDDYSFLGVAPASQARLAFSPAGGVSSCLSSPRGLLTGTAMRVLGTNSFIVRVYYYDDLRRVVETRENNIRGEYEAVYTTHTFTGRPLTVLRQTLSASGSLICQETSAYTYDAAERLLTVTQSGGGKTVTRAVSYGAHGLPSSTLSSVGGYSATYAHDPRGRLTEISGPGFFQHLYYETSAAGGQGCFSGRLHDVAWRCGSQVTRTYTYGYDQYGRLSSADYTDNNAGGDLPDADGFHSPGADFSCGYGYDREDNITSLLRNGVTGSDWGLNGRMENSFGAVDDLEYSRDGHHLTLISDDAGSVPLVGSYDLAPYGGTDCFAYDGRGRMTRDMTKGVTSVTYNCLDLPSKVTFQDGNTVSYSYSADGALLRAVYTTGLTPLFLAGAQPSPRSLYLGVTREYCGGRVYENGELRYGLFDGGYYTMPSPADTLSLHLLVRDYRGDVRLVVDEGGGMEEATDYYPYGMPFHSHLSPVQPWKTCGKELDSRFGLHWLDFGARRYDFSKSQWLTPDPLADHSYTKSPYAYCGADPVNYVDPDGRKTYLFFTQMPYAYKCLNIMHQPTHSFIVVKTNKNTEYFAFGTPKGGLSGKLTRVHLDQDINIYEEYFEDNRVHGKLKNVIEIKPPAGVSQSVFDQTVINVAESFYEGEDSPMRYNISPIYNMTLGNCNSSTTTVLYKSGISLEELDDYKSQVKGITWGFGLVRPWTKDEQIQTYTDKESIKEQLEYFKNNGY